jgi:hypothetical protein
MMDVVATIIRNDIGILDEVTELEKSMSEDEAEVVLQGPGPGVPDVQNAPVSALNAYFMA